MSSNKNNSHKNLDMHKLTEKLQHDMHKLQSEIGRVKTRISDGDDEYDIPTVAESYLEPCTSPFPAFSTDHRKLAIHNSKQSYAIAGVDPMNNDGTINSSAGYKEAVSLVLPTVNRSWCTTSQSTLQQSNGQLEFVGTWEKLSSTTYTLVGFCFGQDDNGTPFCVASYRPGSNGEAAFPIGINSSASSNRYISMSMESGKKFLGTVQQRAFTPGGSFSTIATITTQGDDFYSASGTDNASRDIGFLLTSTREELRGQPVRLLFTHADSSSALYTTRVCPLAMKCLPLPSLLLPGLGGGCIPCMSVVGSFDGTQFTSGRSLASNFFSSLVGANLFAAGLDLYESISLQHGSMNGPTEKGVFQWLKPTLPNSSPHDPTQFTADLPFSIAVIRFTTTADNGDGSLVASAQAKRQSLSTSPNYNTFSPPVLYDYPEVFDAIALLPGVTCNPDHAKLGARLKKGIRWLGSPEFISKAKKAGALTVDVVKKIAEAAKSPEAKAAAGLLSSLAIL